MSTGARTRRMRKREQTAKPSRLPVSITSRTITSNGVVIAAATASSPSATRSTLNPSSRSPWRMDTAVCRSSSTTRIRIAVAYLPATRRRVSRQPAAQPPNDCKGAPLGDATPGEDVNWSQADCPGAAGTFGSRLSGPRHGLLSPGAGGDHIPQEPPTGQRRGAGQELQLLAVPGNDPES